MASKNRFSITRRAFLAFGLAIAAGLVSRGFLGSKNISGFTNQEILDRFLALPESEQIEAMNLIEDRANKASGMDTVFDRIIKPHEKIILSEQEYKARVPVARSREILGPTAQTETHRTSAYDRVSDMIVSPYDIRMHLMGIIKDRETRKGVLAHEVLHKIQSDASPNTPLYRITAKYETETAHGRVISDEDVAKIAHEAKMDEAEVRRQIPLLYRRKEKEEIYFELASRMLEANMQVKDEKSEWTLDEKLTDPRFYNMKKDEVAHALSLIEIIYGMELLRGETDVDFRVSQFVGMNSYDEAQLYQAMLDKIKDPRDKTYSARGQSFLAERSQKLDKVRSTALEVLADYF